MNNGTDEEGEEDYFTMTNDTAFQFYTNKIDSLINKIKEILQNDRYDPIIAEVITTTPDHVKFHIYKHFLSKLVKDKIDQNIIEEGDEGDLEKATTLLELMGLLQSDDIFDGETHLLRLENRKDAKIVKAAAITALDHVHNDKDPISQKFDWEGEKGTLTVEYK